MNKDKSDQGVVDFEDVTTKVEPLPVTPSPQLSGYNPGVGVDIRDFLSRPVIIHQGVWAEEAAQTVLFDILPYKLFLEDTFVKSKTNYYSLVRGNLHIRVTMNGSPAHYGMLSIRSWPYRKYESHFDNWESEAFCLPGFFMNPAEDSVGEFTIPFFSQRKWIDLAPVGHADPDADRAQGVDFVSLVAYVVAPLRTVTDTGKTVGYTIFAWMSEVELAVPTPYAVLQAGVHKRVKKGAVKDEYGKGPVSSTASAIAVAAGALSYLPVIGPFAKATEIGATAVSAIASLFGFSRPIVIADPALYRPRPYSSLALAEGGDTSAKLSLDPKNEVTISPATTGLEGIDEMTIKYIGSHEGLVKSAGWQYTSAAGSRLFSLPVAPGAVRTWAGSLDFEAVYKPSPLWYLTRAYMYWTGSLRYTIRIPSSRFHRGRIQIAYFPRAKGGVPATDLTNSTWNMIIDISTETEVTFEVPWTQSVPWLQTHSIDHAGDAVYMAANGILVCDVLNELVDSSPNADPVNIFVTVSAGEDFQVAKPSIGRLYNYIPSTYYGALPPLASRVSVDPSALEGVYTHSNALTAYNGGTQYPVMLQGWAGEDGAAGAPECTHTFPLEHFGEGVASIRPLLRRYCLAATAEDTSVLGEDHVSLVIPHFTYDELETRSSTTQVKSEPTFFTWFKRMYTGMRGSSRYKVSMDAHNGGTSNNFATARAYLCDEYGYHYSNGFSHPYGAGDGLELAPLNITGGLEVEAPYYFPFNFALTSTVNNPSKGTPTDHYASPNSILYVADGVPINGANQATSIEVYNALGEDFNFYYFRGAPAVVKLLPATGRDDLVAPPP